MKKKAITSVRRKAFLLLNRLSHPYIIQLSYLYIIWYREEAVSVDRNQDLLFFLIFSEKSSGNVWWFLKMFVPLHPLNEKHFSEALKKEFFETFT